MQHLALLLAAGKVTTCHCFSSATGYLFFPNIKCMLVFFTNSPTPLGIQQLNSIPDVTYLEVAADPTS